MNNKITLTITEFEAWKRVYDSITKSQIIVGDEKSLCDNNKEAHTKSITKGYEERSRVLMKTF